MRDVFSVTPQTKIFGIPSALPIYVSPSSNALLGHPLGEINITRGAARTGIVQGISAAASIPLVEILDEKEKMGNLLAKVKDTSKYDPRIKDIARQLIASTFYFELLSASDTEPDGTTKLQGKSIPRLVI